MIKVSFVLFEVSEEVHHEVRHSWEQRRVWAHITQHTWRAMTKWAVAMVMRCYSIPELQGHRNVIFPWLPLRNAKDKWEPEHVIELFSIHFSVNHMCECKGILLWKKSRNTSFLHNISFLLVKYMFKYMSTDASEKHVSHQKDYYSHTTYDRK